VLGRSSFTYRHEVGPFTLSTIIPERWVSVREDTTPPTLTVEAPSEVTGPWSKSCAIIRRTATDRSGINSVKWGVNEEPHQPATNDTGDWWRWGAEMVLPNPGRHTIEVRATDLADNESEQDEAVVVRTRDWSLRQSTTL
jgi:hypothetical protein